MGRRELEITDINEILRILDTAKILHLGLNDNGQPYVVPMNYGYTYEDGKIVFYVHGALRGRKIDVIKNNPACCVQFDCDSAMYEGSVACKYGYTYYSFMGFGKAQIVEEPEEKMKALTVLMKTMTGKDFEFNEKLVSVVSVIRIECDSFSAKHRPLPAQKP